MSERNQFDAWARNQYRGEKGYLRSLPLACGQFIHDDGGTLKQLTAVAGGKVGFAYASSGLLCLQWDDTADDAQKAVVNLAVPADYRVDAGVTGERSALLLVARVRKLDGTGSATDNTDLKLNVTASWQNPAITDAGVETDGDAALNTLASTVSFTDLAGTATLPAKAASTAEEEFRTLIADISGGMSSAQLLALKPGASITISIAPNEAVGTGLYIEVTSLSLHYSGHLTPTESWLRAKALRSS